MAGAANPCAIKTHDVLSDTYTSLTRMTDSYERLVEDGLKIRYSDSLDRFTIREGDPLSARVDSKRKIAPSRGDWRVAVGTRSSMAADRTHFHIIDTVEVFEGDERIFVENWDRRIPRDHL